MKYIILFILLISTFISAITQTYTRKIEWNKDSDEKNNSYNFTNKHESSSNHDFYFESINLHNITPIDISFIPLNIKSLTDYNISDSEKLSNIFDFKWEVNKSSNENILQISINTKRNNTFGGIDLLTEFKIVINKTTNLNTKRASFRTKQNSVIASGDWYKIEIPEETIYKISYDKLISLGFNNPEKISLFGLGGEQLSFYVEQTNNPLLKQIPVFIEKGSDNVFNSGDYILFFATGADHWKYDSQKDFFWLNKHNYSNSSYYFLTETESPLRVALKTIASPANQTSEKHLAFQHHEINKKNILESGRKWYGESFDVETSQSITLNFPNVIQNSKSKIEVSVVTESKSSSSFAIKIEDKTETITIPRSDYNNYQQGVEKNTFFTFIAASSNQTVNLTYNKPLPSSIAWLDYITINNWCKNNYNNKAIVFQDPSVAGVGNITEFSITNCNNALKIWEVTDLFNPKLIELSISGSNGTFKNNTDNLQKHVIFNPTEASEPVFVEQIKNQNIEGSTPTELVIITTPELYNTAEKLAAFHKQNDNISYSIYTPQEIYNEFSSGSPDICAIRNFLSFLYKQPNSSFKYLLFLGDGSYNNSPEHIAEKKLLPTYQSLESITSTKTFTSDDFFGLLDDGEGEGEGLLDIGIGRIPAETVAEAELVVNKMIKYYTNDNPGEWQNKITSIGDDGDGNAHMNNAENLNKYVNTIYPEMLIQKIYLDSYILDKSDIELYPTVNNEISNSIKQGTLIVNYSGHGSPEKLAHESIVTKEDVDTWNNINLPVFVTATCSFSKWDDDYKSTGEHILFKENGGGIALFSTTRMVFSNSNYTLNYNFYTNLKKTDPSGDYLRMGDIIRLTKTAMPNDLNKRNFSLLGDPLLRLQIPKKEVLINNITNNETQNIDTLKAFDKITLKGNINTTGNIDASFNGTAFCTVYDKKSSENTLNNKGEGSFIFSSWKNIIFQGKATVENGLFSITFMVPKDINYNYGDGKICISASSDKSSASGYKSIKVGGTGSDINNDEIGPEIELYMNNTNFSNGGLTNSSPNLIALLNDDSGINTMNNSLGHEISIIIDKNDNSKININQFFTNQTDTYKQGRVEYNLEKLKDGPHTIDLKAWDIMNNTNSKSIDFIVANDSKIAIQHLLNYPNPFTEKTTFYFNHNRPFTFLEAIIQIYSPSGKLIKTLKTSFSSSSFKSEPIEWDGLDDFGNKIGRGVYIYRLKLRSNKTETIETIEKLVVLK